MKQKIIRLTQINVPEKVRCKLNSYLGLLSHYKSYHLRQAFFGIFRLYIIMVTITRELPSLCCIRFLRVTRTFDE